MSTIQFVVYGTSMLGTTQALGRINDIKGLAYFFSQVKRSELLRKYTVKAFDGDKDVTEQMGNSCDPLTLSNMELPFDYIHEQADHDDALFTSRHIGKQHRVWQVEKTMVNVVWSRQVFRDGPGDTLIKRTKISEVIWLPVGWEPAILWNYSEEALVDFNEDAVLRLFQTTECPEDMQVIRTKELVELQTFSRNLSAWITQKEYPLSELATAMHDCVSWYYGGSN